MNNGLKDIQHNPKETITQENIGKPLAVFVNGLLMNAPQVNSEITSIGLICEIFL